jgi:hypothetical protein
LPRAKYAQGAGIAGAIDQLCDATLAPGATPGQRSEQNAKIFFAKEMMNKFNTGEKSE